ncbi:MAG: hypothetical protein HY938_06080 [Nitrosomonadales bacterium]|nr:hypothetical protein [Nitrosomonadales bacterium]
MKNVIRPLGVAIVFFASGCSSDTARRTTYETLQNVRQQECLKTPSSDCGKRESYEDYQRKRKELGL